MTAPVSILLPVYNAAATIEAAVHSCLAQTCSDFELLLVDDGSTDGTAELLSKLATTDPRVKVITLPHAGIVRALNKGLQNAGAPFIARMDADDRMHPQRLEKQLQFLREHSDIGLVSCRVAHGGDAVAQEGYATYIDWINSLLTPEQIALNRFVESPLSHPSVLFRRELVEKFGSYRDGDFPEDYELWLRWLEHGVQMAKVHETLLTWSDPPARLSRTDARYSPGAFSRIKAGYLARFIHSKCAGRKTWLCGAGKNTRRKSDFLLGENVAIAGYIDVDPGKTGKIYNGLPVISATAIPPKEEAFIVSYVGNRGAREAIRLLLAEKGFSEGDDFIMAG